MFTFVYLMLLIGYQKCVWHVEIIPKGSQSQQAKVQEAGLPENAVKWCLFFGSGSERSLEILSLEILW